MTPAQGGGPGERSACSPIALPLTPPLRYPLQAAPSGGHLDDFLRKSFWVYNFYPDGSQIGDFTGQKLKI